MTKPRKPRKPLQVRAGRYLTRDGSIATIKRNDISTESEWVWIGKISGERGGESWKWSGAASCIPNNAHPSDLVKRLPDAKKPKPPCQRKAGMQWGVWIPAKDKAEAERNERHLQLTQCPLATLRRLPTQKPAGRGR
jgi:hypothetical protein